MPPPRTSTGAFTSDVIFSLVMPPARRDLQNLVGRMTRISNVPVPKSVVRVIRDCRNDLESFRGGVAGGGRPSRRQIQSRACRGKYRCDIPIFAQIPKNALVLIAVDMAEDNPEP